MLSVTLAVKKTTKMLNLLLPKAGRPSGETGQFPAGWRCHGDYTDRPSEASVRPSLYCHEPVNIQSAGDTQGRAGHREVWEVS